MDVQHPVIFFAALRRQRERLNQRFALARRQSSRLQPAPFLSLLSDALAPTLNALGPFSDATQDHILDVLYTLALELVATDLLGSGVKHQDVLDTWRQLLPACAPHLRTDPRALAGALTNATVQFRRHPELSASDWRKLLLLVLPFAETHEHVLELGRVCAWRVGLVALRERALTALKTLPFPALVPLLELPADFPPSLRAPWLDAIRAKPWTPPSVLAHQLLHPETTLRSQLALVGRVGDFTGLGGELLRPPQLAVSGEHLWVSDGTHQFTVFADCFGQSLYRLPGQPPLLGPTHPAAFACTSEGLVSHASAERLLPHLKGAHQVASTRTELGVVFAHSHRLSLVALVEHLP